MKTAKKTITLSKFNVFTLVLLVSFASVGALAISAALPMIARTLAISKEAAQLTISLYMVGFAIGPLIFAPLSNQFGRKPLILISLIISALAAIGCLVSSFFHSFTWMVIARILMALAGSGCLKLSWDIAGDLLRGKCLTRMSSYFVLSFSLAPPFAIAIGGFLSEYLGWRSIFGFLILYSALLFLLSLKLPETMRIHEKNALSLKEIAFKYHQTIQDHFLIIGSFILGTVSSSIYLFGTEAPFIGEHLIKLSPATFGLLALFTNIGNFLGGMSGVLLSKRWKAISIFFLGVLIFFLGAVSLTLFFYEHVITVWSLFVTIGVIFFGASLSYSSITSLAMSEAKDKSYASSLMNFINLGFTVLVVLGVGHLTTKYLLAFPALYLGLSIISCILGFMLKKFKEVNQ